MKDFDRPLFETLQVWPDPVPRPGADQMALDEAILTTVPHPILRVYCWSEPAVSFGYSQSLQMVANMFPRRPLVRRWTGGGIVEHDRDWTFSLMVPAAAPAAQLRPTETYERIHDAVMAALAGAGVATRLAGCDDRRTGAACFVAPALHDVLSGNGQKLCGGAQRRTRHGFLHQGSLQGVTVPDGFAEKLAGLLAEKTAPFSPPPDLDQRARVLAAQRYGAAAWAEKIP